VLEYTETQRFIRKIPDPLMPGFLGAHHVVYDKVYLQAYCTDGEKALREALGQEFGQLKL